MIEKQSWQSDAGTCRINGWSVGTELCGKEYGRVDRIRITAIGESLVLARAVMRGNRIVNERECTWTLSCRRWAIAKSISE